MFVRIVLLPDITTETLVKKYSLLLASELPTLFTLDDKHLPHVTVLNVDIEDEHLERIVTEIQSVAKHQNTINVQSEEIKCEEGTFMGLYFKENHQIVALRETIANTIEDFVKGTPSFKSPHITITRMKHERDVKSALNLLSDFPQRTIELSKIAICNSLENGTTSKIYSVFSFK
jgi:2'-5' RNA ligase